VRRTIRHAALLAVLALAGAASDVRAQDARGTPVSRGDCESQDRACTCLALTFARVTAEVRDASVANSCAEEIMVSFCQYSDRQPQPDAKCDLTPVRGHRREFFARIADCSELVWLFACSRADYAAGRCRIPERVVALNGALQGSAPAPR
jgi:hypothetical protein